MNKKLIIELRGVEFVNKGAELMLHAILQKIREFDKNIIVVMESSPKVPKSRRKEYGILTKVKFRKFKIELSPLLNLLPSSFLNNIGYFKEKQIDIVLEASGFAFGDQWGPDYASRRLGAKIEQWKQGGKKIILLPQAFGSFKNENLKNIMQKIVQYSDLIFAREKQSLAYLQEISKSRKITCSPDFTSLIKGSIPTGFNVNSNDVAIIPNYKMVNESDSLEVYSDFLIKAIEIVRSKEKKPYFLIHEGKRDLEIGNFVNSKLQFPIDIISYENALDIKGIISTANFIICSRFHGVVSALSQGVPCITTSWSHKYEMLMEEYESENHLINKLSDFEKLERLILEFSNSGKRDEISQKLINISTKHKKATELMWEKVFSIIIK